MEYGEGGDLFRKISNSGETIINNLWVGDICGNIPGKFSESRARVIFKQICSAVNYMHSRGLIHRDVKAENIFFTWKDHVLLGDFGFATRLEKADQHLTTFCGSPPYAAPELYVVTWTQPTFFKGGEGGSVKTVAMIHVYILCRQDWQGHAFSSSSI